MFVIIFLVKVKEYSGRFYIRIIMRNDNSFFRKVDKILKIVFNKEKVITVDDLSFSDLDVNFDFMKLRYIRERILNGEIVNSEDNKEVFIFI